MGIARRLVALVLAVAASSLAVPAARAAGDGPAAAEGGKSSLSDWIGNDKVQFFRLTPFNIPVIRDGRVVRQVSIAVTLETRNLDRRNMVIEKRHALHNAFLRDLYAVLSMDVHNDRDLNLETVKVRLRRVAERVLGPGIASNVLVESAYARRLN